MPELRVIDAMTSDVDAQKAQAIANYEAGVYRSVTDVQEPNGEGTPENEVVMDWKRTNRLLAPFFASL